MEKESNKSKPLKCLSNSDKKAYVIPTNKWLQPIKPLITNSSDAQQILARMVDKEDVLVRVTSNSNGKLKIINKQLQSISNFPLVYCTIECNESTDILDTDYIINGKPAKGFCNGKSSDGYVTLEVMKYYKANKLDKLLKQKISLDAMKNLLNQALCAQLLAFQAYGFVHNDININNFIIEEQQTMFEYKYDFGNNIGFKSVKGKINFKVYVIDFGQAELLNPELRSQYIPDYWINSIYQSAPKLTNPKYYIKKADTLPNSLFETIKEFLNLCPNYSENLDKINKIQVQQNQILDYYNYYFNKSYSTMSRHTNDFKKFVNRTTHDSIAICNEYYQVLFGEPLTTIDFAKYE